MGRTVVLAGLSSLFFMASVAGASPDGEELYRRWCAQCHGEAGDGRGPAAPALVLNGQAPRDFTRGQFKFKSTRSGEGPLAADLERTITNGLAASPMPYFRDLLSEAEIASLARLVRGFSRGIRLAPDERATRPSRVAVRA